MIFSALGILSALWFVFPGFVSSLRGSEPGYGLCGSVCCGLCSGLSGGLAFVCSFGLFFKKIFDEPGEKSSLIYGFVYWLFYFMGALYWLVYPLTIDLSLHWMLIPFALIAIPAYLATPLLLPIYLAKKFCKNVWSSAFVFTVLTFSVIYLQGHYAPGFPWALPGYVWSGDSTMMQSLSIWGIYGQTFFTFAVGSIVGAGFYWRRINLKKSYWAVGGALILLISLFLLGFFRIPKSPCEFTHYKVRCVQGSILQKNKMDKNLSAHNLNLYLNLSQMKSKRNKMESKHGDWNPDFVIWPEASVPYLFTSKSKMLSEKLASVVPHNGYLLAGAVRKDFSNGDVYNSVIVLDEFGRNIANYDKKHLVPFGEYIPFRRFIPKVFAPIANSIGDFSVGKSSNVIKLKGLRIAFTVCYEAIFSGEFISKDSSNDSDVDVIVNVTNDAWFGHTSEPIQHLNIVRARAIEEGIPLIRVTNFGVSAVFDAYGRKVDFLETDEVGVIDCYIPKKIEKTFFRKFFMDKMKLKQ